MKVILFLLSILVSSASYCYAQYDDDIYYVPKPKKETSKVDYSNQSTYQREIGNINDMDVDAYNRRGSYADEQSDSSRINSDEESDFTYTDRIKRFHNPTVVIEANDPDLYDLYYLNPSSVNIVVGNSWNPWGSSWVSWNLGWSSPWYSPWYWNSWYSPWYGWNDPFWGPSWGWNNPWWGWGPPHYHPVAPPVYGNNGYYSGNGRRPVGVGNPGSSVRPSDNNGRRPGYTTGGRRPTGTSGTSVNPGTSTRPSTSGQNSGGYRGTPGSNYNQSGGNSSTPSRNNNSTVGRRPGNSSSGESIYRGSGSNNNNSNSNFSAPSRGSSGSSFGGYRGGSSGNSGGGGGGRGGRR